jgi:hypothetical protein
VAVATNTLQGAVVSSTISPLLVPFDGALTSATATLWQGAVGGTAVSGIASLVGGNTVAFAPTVRPASGQPFVLAITATDTLGRAVTANVSFTTSAMVCTNTTIWSNPATFSTAYQDCVADVGVQTLISQSNALQDTSCVVTVGTPLSAACRAYMANGTMALANTSLVVNGHSTLWMAYIGTDKVSTLVLLDANAPTSLVPLGMLALPSALAWIIGNPTGASINIGVAKQATWDTASAALVIK